MNDFRRFVVTALVAGLVAGLWLSVARQFWVVPIILQAETFETKPADHAAGHQDATGPAGHEHLAATVATPEWEPAEGLERTTWTWVANGLASFGFALLLVAGYGVSGRRVSAVRGLLWGAAGFAVFSLAPALGLPPALPGSPETPLVARQAWWLATIVATAGGLWLIVLGPARWWRWLGVPLLVVPHLVSVPVAAEALAPPLVELTRRFIAVTLTVNLSAWLALGAVSGWLWSRQPRPLPLR